MVVAHGVPVPLLYALPFHDSSCLHLLTCFLLSQGADGSRQPSKLELELATEQGKAFYKSVSRVNFA